MHDKLLAYTHARGLWPASNPVEPGVQQADTKPQTAYNIWTIGAIDDHEFSRYPRHLPGMS